MINLAILATVSLLFLFVCLSRGVWAGIYLAALLSVVFSHKLTNNSSVVYTGLAAEAPELWTYSAVIFGGAILIVAQGRIPVPRIFVPLVLLLVIGIIFWWPANVPQVQAGMIQLVGGLMAWSVGAAIGRDLRIRVGMPGFIVSVTLAVVLLQFLVATAQFGGLDIFPIDPSIKALMGSRVNGTMNHPNNLGKLLLLLLIVLTLFSQSGDKKIRRKAMCGIAIAAIPLALTGGRAVFLAGISVVVLSHIMNKRSKNRFLIPFGVVMLVAPFVGSFVDRFEADPNGGSRPYLTQLALSRITQDPFTGMGPNLYVYIVGQTDELTASGLPVHNGFLLVTAELGLIGALALFVPFLALGLKALKHRHTYGGAGAAARTFLAALPALSLVVATGWAMLSGPYLYLWFLTMGILVSQFHAGTTDINAEPRSYARAE